MTDGFLTPQNTQGGLRLMAELERSSKDTWIVINPTEQDYVVWWNRSAPNGGEKWTVPNKNKDMGNGKGKRTVPQYIMVNYADQMSKKMMIDRADAAVKEENERRISKGMAKMNKWEDQQVFETQPEFNLNNEEEREKIMLNLIGGIVEHYGMEEDIDNQEPVETKPALERIIERFRKQPLQQEETILPSPSEDFSELKINDLRSQVKASGQTVNLRDKKEDLIAKLQGDE